MAMTIGRSLLLYQTIMVIVASIQGQSVEVTPRETTVLPGQNVTILCRVGYALGHCRVEIPGHPQPYILKPGEGENGVMYYGNGLQKGECGASLDRAEDKNNGIIKCTVPPQSGSRELVGQMKLTVARAPLPPVLEVSRGTDGPNSYRVNDEFHARCIVADGRPAAKISWFLDDEPLFDGLHQPTVYDTPGSDLQTSAQNLSRRLQMEDHGKLLRCVSEHIALQGGRNVAQRQLEIKYMPQPREDPIGVFGIKIGDNGLVNVTIRSNPAPGLEWVVDGNSIPAGSVDNTGRIEAATPQPLGAGYYNATLRIATVTREDTERNYLLKAYNDQGLQEYNIRISTMDEPQGVELDIGSIVGIVVAVLVVLIAVFLIVFAKATNRWCFGESRQSEPQKKTSGESSDTESASGHGKDRHGRIEAARTMAAAGLNRALSLGREILPGRGKNKDKVAQTETEEPKNIHGAEEVKPLQQEAQIPQQQPVAEDAKQGTGLVYAELSLKPNENLPKPPPLDKTEYAEIVYTNEQKDVQNPEAIPKK